MFTSSNGDYDIQKSHINDVGEFVVTAGLTNTGILGKTNVKAKIFEKNTITIDMFGNPFFRNFEYKMVTHARVFSLKPLFEITERQGLFIASSLYFLNKLYGYENMCSWEKIKNDTIKLPVQNDKINFEFMETFVAELKAQHVAELEAQNVAELEAYLKVTGLNDYELTEEEIKAIENYNSIDWKSFNLKDLFGSSTRGKRLKSADRIKGNLPFVTAGEADNGISDFIGNKVQIFENNTTTIDMFGSAKYRNYKYGADDHIAVVHTEKIPKFASIFVTSAIHKSSYNSQYSYGRNFYAKDADILDIMLPQKDEKPDYNYMNKVISAIQKLVIKDVVKYAEMKIETTKKVITN